MARNEISVSVPPDAVWEVLADPRLYASWVVGASSVRKVDGQWPQPGAVLHHSQMMLLHDTTSVLSSEPQRRIVLEARARPAVVARVEVTLEPDGDGTRVVVDERVIGGLAAVLPDAVNDPLVHARNTTAVRRLAALAEIGRHLGRS